jgi:aryl-alcohol dehydrogenase-like predicted oxidoreductase
MIYGRIPGIDKPCSRLVMGSMIYSPRDLSLACTMLDSFVALGGNAIDTAHQYGRGEAERAIGQWMTLRGNRAEVVVITKGCREEVLGRDLRVNPAAITADLTESLERLQTSYIDLYLLHRDDPDTPVGALVDCLNEQYQDGRIRAFGGSNWSIARLEAANEYARARGLVPFVASSPNFSLAVWNEAPWAGCLSVSNEDREWYERNQYPLLAWSAQAQGFFTGRYTPEDRSDAAMVRCWYSPRNFGRLQRARDLGLRQGASATAVALAYVLCQPFPTFALIGPHSSDELHSSAQALTVTLTADDVRWLQADEPTA